MKVLIIGDSHTRRLSAGLRSLQDEEAVDDGLRIKVQGLGTGRLLATPFFRPMDGYAEVVEPEFREYMERIPPEPGVYHAIGLSMLFHPSRIMRSILRGGYCVGEFIPGRQAISESLFRELSRQDQTYVLQLCDLLKAAGYRVFAVSAPGTFRDYPLVSELGAAQALRIERLHRSEVLHQLERRGIEAVDIPTACRDADGFMKQEFRAERADDAHHGNAAFGKLMMQHVLELLRSPPPGVATRE
ncbi:hypothetical protein [Tropicimonas aquimaris]|uniref:SGNH/GDSL hydrolase family protein n=1 Tax=Tropicimonas aquimaris TaxID=914152 RepID=A0ABW3IVR7_9RHOB